MQDIPQDDTQQLQANHPKSITTKSTSKIINNRYINQNIYKMFLQKRYDQCLKFISRCQQDQFKIYIKALIAKNEFKLDKALEYFSQCQMLDRMNYHYLKHMAKTFILLGKYRSALQVAKDAMKLQQCDHQIYYIFGKLSMALNDQKNALVHFDLSLSKQKNQAAALQKARIMLRQKKYDQSLQVLEAITEYSTENAEIYQLMAEIKYYKGQLDNAVGYYKRALEIDGGRFNSLLTLGTVSQVREEAEAAMEYYKRAYKISPNSAALWNNIAIYMFDKKKLIAAYSCLKRALFLDPFRWDIHANLGLLFMKHKKYLQAQIHFKSAVKIKKDGVLFNLWGICLRNLNDTKNAEACFAEGMRLEKENEEIRYNYVLALKQNNKLGEAKEEFKKFMQEVNDPKVKKALYEVKEQFQ